MGTLYILGSPYWEVPIYMRTSRYVMRGTISRAPRYPQKGFLVHSTFTFMTETRAYLPGSKSKSQKQKTIERIHKSQKSNPGGVARLARWPAHPLASLSLAPPRSLASRSLAPRWLICRTWLILDFAICHRLRRILLLVIFKKHMVSIMGPYRDI